MREEAESVYLKSGPSAFSKSRSSRGNSRQTQVRTICHRPGAHHPLVQDQEPAILSNGRGEKSYSSATGAASRLRAGIPARWHAPSSKRNLKPCQSAARSWKFATWKTELEPCAASQPLSGATIAAAACAKITVMRASSAHRPSARFVCRFISAQHTLSRVPSLRKVSRNAPPSLSVPNARATTDPRKSEEGSTLGPRSSSVRSRPSLRCPARPLLPECCCQSRATPISDAWNTGRCRRIPHAHQLHGQWITCCRTRFRPGRQLQFLA